MTHISVTTTSIIETRVPVKNLKGWIPGRTMTPDGLQVSVSNSERSVSKVRNQKLALSGIYGTCNTIYLCKICFILLFNNVPPQVLMLFL